MIARSAVCVPFVPRACRYYYHRHNNKGERGGGCEDPDARRRGVVIGKEGRKDETRGAERVTEEGELS